MPVPDTQQPTRPASAIILPIVCFLALSFLFCFPLLQDLYSSCRGDWDYCFSLYEIPSVSLFEFGQFPFWNPYWRGGMPLLANPHAGFLSPITLTTAFFGTVAGLKLSVWLHTFVGLWGMWYLAGHMGITGPARLATTFIFMFSSPWAFHLAEGHMTWLPAAYLPIIMLSYLRGVDNRKWLAVAGILTSLLIYEGGTYVLAYSLLFLYVYAFAQSLTTRTLKPIVTVVAITILASALAAPKLFPSLELLSGHPRVVDPGAASSWGDILGSFIEREITMGSSNWETSSYVGVTVVILFIGSVFIVRKQLPLVTAAIFMFLVSIGNFIWFSPWTLLHKLPLFRNFLVPTRSLVVVCFAIALLVGMLLTKLLQQNTWWATCFVSIVTLVIGIDLACYGSSVFLESTIPVQINVFRRDGPMRLDKPAELYRIVPDQTTGLGHSVASLHQPFRQILVPDLERFRHGAWSNQYLPLLQNRGVVDAYETLPTPHYALPVNDREYRGEHYLLNGGSLELLKWSPNRLQFRIRADHEETLVINQNFWKGWRASKGSVINHRGLLAVQLPPGEYGVSVSYLPGSLFTGVGVFVAALFSVFFLLKSPRQNRNEPTEAIAI